MTTIEAETLEVAYAKASKVLQCSISDLDYIITQHPSNGIMGFMKKNAIIVATCKKIPKETTSQKERVKKKTIKKEIPKEIKQEKIVKKALEIEKAVAIEEIVEIVKKEIPTQEERIATEIIKVVKEEDPIVNAFFEADKEIEIELEEVYEEEAIVYDELALLIENQLKELLGYSCFDIDIVEVDVRDNTALIFLDGEDAALLIGKEGYRYNALSYMIFNWLHTKYELFIKLEIAEFLTKQQEMIASYIQPVIANVEKNGKGKTRFLDGVLVQIALEQLREKFPNKYVAIKSTKNARKFVVINEFNNPIKPKK